MKRSHRDDSAKSGGATNVMIMMMTMIMIMAMTMIIDNDGMMENSMKSIVQ